MSDLPDWSPDPITRARFIAADMGVFVDESVIAAAEARGREEGERVLADPQLLAAAHERHARLREAIRRFKQERRVT